MTGHNRLMTVLGGTLAPDDNPFRMAGHVHGTSPRKIECTCIYEVSALTDSYIALFIVFCCTEYVTRWVCFQLSLFILFYFSTSVITSPSLPLFETLALLQLFIPFTTSASFMVFLCCRIVHVADLLMPYWMANWDTSKALSYLAIQFFLIQSPLLVFSSFSHFKHYKVSWVTMTVWRAYAYRQVKENNKNKTRQHAHQDRLLLIEINSQRATLPLVSSRNISDRVWDRRSRVQQAVNKKSLKSFGQEPKHPSRDQFVPRCQCISEEEAETVACLLLWTTKHSTPPTNDIIPLTCELFGTRVMQVLKKRVPH